MTKYHVNPKTGDTGICRAVEKCPFGNMDYEHFPDRKDALRHAELLIEFDVLKTTVGKLTPLYGDEETLAHYSNAHEHFSIYPRMEGSQRVTYFLGDGTVIKIPKTDEGEFSNLREANLSKETGKEGYIPIAEAKSETIEIQGVEYEVLRMEEVTPVLIDYKTYPQWIASVDCGQVGLDKNGKLVAYDL